MDLTNYTKTELANMAEDLLKKIDPNVDKAKALVKAKGFKGKVSTSKTSSQKEDLVNFVKYLNEGQTLSVSAKTDISNQLKTIINEAATAYDISPDNFIKRVKKYGYSGNTKLNASVEEMLAFMSHIKEEYLNEGFVKKLEETINEMEETETQHLDVLVENDDDMPPPLDIPVIAPTPVVSTAPTSTPTITPPVKYVSGNIPLSSIYSNATIAAEKAPIQVISDNVKTILDIDLLTPEGQQYLKNKILEQEQIIKNIQEMTPTIPAAFIRAVNTPFGQVNNSPTENQKAWMEYKRSIGF